VSVEANGIYTREVSDKVADGVQYLMQHPSDKRYLEVPIIRFRRRRGDELPVTEESVLSIRLIDESPQIISRAGGGEIARCITREGKRVDIIFGRPAERHLAPATVEIEE
jgi:hypothetical protein